MEEVKGVVYTVDEEDFIVSEFPCDFSYAVDTYMGQRDSHGRRYIVKLFGKPTDPYKRKPKKVFDIMPTDHQQDNSASSTD